MGEMSGAGTAPGGPADGTTGALSFSDMGPVLAADPLANLGLVDRGTGLVGSLPREVRANGLPDDPEQARAAIVDGTDRAARVEDWSETAGDSVATAARMRELNAANELAVVFTTGNAADPPDPAHGLRHGQPYVAEMLSPDRPMIYVTDIRLTHRVTPMRAGEFADAIRPEVVVVGPPGSRAG